MNGPNFAALTRRAPLAMLGAAGLGVAGKDGIAAAKKKKKHKKGKGNSECARQAQVWELIVDVECDDSSEPTTCQELLACGEPLETCNFTEFFTCFRAATSM
jgi:hypothetical protein